jgi:hypothetical protein
MQQLSSVPNVRKFGKDMDVTVPRGKMHNYLGIQFDFMQKGKVVVMTMDNYIQELLKGVPDNLFKGMAVSPTGNHLFNVNPSCQNVFPPISSQWYLSCALVCRVQTLTTGTSWGAALSIYITPLI